MRLAFCIHTYAPVVGGSESLVGELAQRLARRGHEVGVFTSNASSTQAFVDPSLPRLATGECIDRGVSIARLPYVGLAKPVRRLANQVMTQFHVRRWPGYGRVKVAWVGPHLVGLKRSLRSFGPERITAAAYPFAHMNAAQRWARKRRVPYVALPCLHPQDPWAFDNPWIEADLRLADAVLALTSYERDYLVALGVEPSRVCVLGLGIDPPGAPTAGTPAQLKTKLGLDQALPMVLFLGRKEESKGVSALVAAARSLWDQGCDVALVLAGPETAWSREQRAALTAALDPRRFCYLEEISSELKEELLSHCDIVALPSQAESFGIVFLEGWARGKPVIGGRTGATCSLVAHEQDGLLVSPGDPGELAQALQILVSDPARAARFGEVGRRKALSRFSWDALVDQAEALYRGLDSSNFVVTRRSAKEEQSPAPVHQPEPGKSCGTEERREEPVAPCAGVSACGTNASVLVVSYNGGADLLAAVSSALDAGAAEVLVVDNHSSDGAPAKIRRRFPQVRLLELPFNSGFAEGNNRGLRLARGEFVVLLNQDAVLDSNALTTFASGFTANPRVGVLAPRILVREEPRVLQSAGLIANQILYACDRGYLELDGPTWRRGGPVVGGSGAALALRRSMLDCVGLFDAALFMYYEDLDLCLRARVAGWEVFYLPEAVAYHRQRADPRSEWHNEFLDHRNRQRLLLKTFSGRSLARHLVGEAAFEVRSVLRLVQARRWKGVQLRTMALLASTLRLRSTLRARRAVQALRRCSDGAIEELLDGGWAYPRAAPPGAALGPMQPAAGGLDFSPAGAQAFSLGWHGPERDERSWFRWTGRYGLAFLNGRGTPTQLRLRTFSLIDQKLDVWLGRDHLGMIPIRGKTWEEHLLSVASTPDDARLLLVPERTYSPADLQSSADRRQLGVACSELTLVE